MKKRRAPSAPIPSTCPICGSRFMARPAKLAIGKDKCCSTSCGATYRWREARLLGGPIKYAADGHRLFGRTTVRACAQCGESFVALVSHVRQGDARFCSLSCIGLYRAAHGDVFNGKSHRWTSEEAKIVGPIGGQVVSDYWKQNPPVPYYKREPQKTRAHRMVHNHVAKGTLQRNPCESCGATENIHGHHDDYRRPLDVKWLCETCHRILHRASA